MSLTSFSLIKLQNLLLYSVVRFDISVKYTKHFTIYIITYDNKKYK